MVERGGLENRCTLWVPWVRIPPPPARQSANLSPNRETFLNRRKLGRYSPSFRIGDLPKSSISEDHWGVFGSPSLFVQESVEFQLRNQEQGIFAFWPPEQGFSETCAAGAPSILADTSKTWRGTKATFLLIAITGHFSMHNRAFFVR